MNLQEIKNKILTNQIVSDSERAFLIANDVEALSAFMVKNNIGNVNLSLKRLGYKTEFKPTEQNVARQLQIIIDQKHIKDFEYILKNYKLDLSKIHKSDDKFVKELIKNFNK